MSNMELKINVKEVWMKKKKGIVKENIKKDEWFIIKIKEKELYSVI